MYAHLPIGHFLATREFSITTSGHDHVRRPGSVLAEPGSKEIHRIGRMQDTNEALVVAWG